MSTMDIKNEYSNSIMDIKGKKVWVLPELEILDGSRTYGGTDSAYCESEWECMDPDGKDAS